MKNFVSCIIAYNSRPIWWNNVLTEKEGQQWDKKLQSIPHENENFVEDYDGYSEYKSSWENTIYDGTNEMQSIRRDFDMNTFKGKIILEHEYFGSHCFKINSTKFKTKF